MLSSGEWTQGAGNCCAEVIVSTDPQLYFSSLFRGAEGITYDAWAGRTAIKGGTKVVFTMNPKCYRRVLPNSEIRIEEP